METDLEEARQHDHVLCSFNAYRYQHLAANNLRRQAFATLPAKQRVLLPTQSNLLMSIDHCIVANAEFLEDIATSARETALLGSATVDGARKKATEHEMEKLRSILRQLHRDWSQEGQAERDQAYVPIIEALDAHFEDVSIEDRRSIRVLVPGCGLGRLPYEIARKGFAAQGNEFSLFMLFASAYVLNQTSVANEFSVHPFCHSVSNIANGEGALREITVPDVCPSELLSAGNMSMAAGDFLDVYREDEGQWDTIVTCFFIDTAHNIVDYLECISRLLKPGGVWINLGPSLWHFEGNASGSIDLPLDEVKALARRIGFVLQAERAHYSD